MKITPVLFTADIAVMRRFCETLGLHATVVAESGGWVSLTGAPESTLGLHPNASADPARAAGRCELSFEADEPLEVVSARLSAAGYEAVIVDESFGRSLRVVDPDGVTVQINEAMADLYGYAVVDEPSDSTQP